MQARVAPHQHRGERKNFSDAFIFKKVDWLSLSGYGAAVYTNDTVARYGAIRLHNDTVQDTVQFYTSDTVQDTVQCYTMIQ